MKQIRKFTLPGLFSAVLGLFFLMGGTGCTRDDASDIQIGKGGAQPIQFQAVTDGSLTKGEGNALSAIEYLSSTLFDVVDGDSLYLNIESSKWDVAASTKVTPYSDRNQLTSSSFGIAIYKQDADDSAVSTWTKYHGPIEAPYDNTEGFWKPSGAPIWPNEGKKVHFFAYAPYASTLTMTAVNGTEPTLAGFEVESSYASQKDLLLANNVTEDNNPLILSGALKAYKLTFNHALAAIRFKVLKSHNITVTSVKVRGVYSGGTLNMNTGEWSNFSTGIPEFTITNPQTTDDGDYQVFKDEYTMMMIPNISGTALTYTPFTSAAEIEVKYTKGGATKTVTTDISAHQWKAGYVLTYVIGDYYDTGLDYDYTFSVAEHPTMDYTGKLSDNGKIVSYREHRTTHTQEPVSWTIDGYYTTEAGAQTGDVSKRIRNGVQGAFITEFSPVEGAGSVAGEQIIISHPGAKYTSQTIVDNGSARDAVIAATAKKERQSGKAYNLSNPADPYSDVVMNTANSYIINGAGYYRFPVVMGNGVKNGALNPIAYEQTGFVDYVNEPITDPYMRGIVPVRTPSAALLVWADFRIEVVDETQPKGSSPIGDKTYYYLNYPGATDGITKSTDATGDVYWINFHVPTATKQGVANIAVIDAMGRSMWSWMIWLTDYQLGVGDIDVEYLKDADPASTDNTTGIVTFMPDNLGWVDNGLLVKESYAKAEVYVRLVQTFSKKTTVVKLVRPAANNVNVIERLGHNPYFQWGRPTAIKPLNFAGATAGSDREGGFNYGFYTGQWVRNSADNIGSVLQNPHYFYSNTMGSWLNSGLLTNMWSAGNTTLYPLSKFTDDKVVKTIYDPCPVGYTGPRQNAFSAFGIGRLDVANTNARGEIRANTNASRWDRGYYFYTNWRSSASVPGSGEIYFPAAGNRAYNTGTYGATNLRHVYVWTAAPINISRAKALMAEYGMGTYPFATAIASHGFPIRPAKEE
ncbi:MAG: fimbrillin family protein [Bacteroidales bacterium]|nr:fimbrillin family protein [Bacteroidales bacterium]